MPISEGELKEILKEPNADIEKRTTLSSDGKNLLTRIPKEIVDTLFLHRGDKLFWYVSKDKEKESIVIKVGYDSNKKTN